MAKKEESSIKGIQKDVMDSIKKIMLNLEKEKIRLAEKDKALQKYEKDLAEREKRIEIEMESFSSEVNDLIKHNEKLASSKE